MCGEYDEAYSVREVVSAACTVNMTGTADTFAKLSEVRNIA